MSDTIKINISVGGVKHPLTVAPEEEPIYREAARMVNERLTAYQKKYRAANLPPEFLMTFAALDIASRYERLCRTTDIVPVKDALFGITRELEEFNQSH